MAIQVVDTLTSRSQGCNVESNRLTCSSVDKFFTLTFEMFFIVGFDGYVKQMNPMCGKILGFTNQEFLSQRWIEFVHPEDQASTLEQLQKLTIDTDTLQFENRVRCQDGSYKWLMWNVTSCQEQQLTYAVARDNTSCKQAEEAQRESEELFRLLVEGVDDCAIIMLDPQGYIISWNTGAERIKQYKSSEIIGQHVSSFYSSEDSQRGKPKQALEIAAREGRFEDEGWRVRKDGSQFWANVVITTLRDEDGKIRGFARVTRDITERKLSQEALQQAHDELEKRVEERTAELIQTNERLKQEIAEHERTEAALRQSKARLKEQAKQLEAETQHATALLQQLQRTQTQLIHTEKMSSLGQLVAGVAHEINNPVGFIYCNLDYATCYIKDLMRLVELFCFHYPKPVAQIQAEMKAVDFDFLMSDLPKLLSSMKVGANRLRKIVLSLQNFLRAEQVEIKPIDIHEGIDSTLMLLQHRLKATDERPEITIAKEYGVVPLVEGYAGQLNQVFMNLLTNAIDVLDTSSDDWDIPRNITISTSLQEISREIPDSRIEQIVPHVVIKIADNGPGISEEVFHKLFDPFFTTKPVGKGPGLGLSISYQIVVENHGGQLTCTSEPGKGAEFLIVIPVQQEYVSSSLSSCA
ncbi:MAG TPA: PAS domain-containing sensor histidine kinase [Cyanobacteria bacterium UBA8543]|nr:PAS domain-containing sensor histidine kinase [Cyanobacteria bacterium UBA8543]